MRQHVRMLTTMLHAGVHLTRQLVSGAVSGERRTRLEPPARFVRDGAGRAVVHRGLNTANDAKYAADGMPAYPAAQIERERKLLGSNLVRLLVFWKHLEPTPGQYDADYLDRLERKVDEYAQHGIRVILDLHQDLWVENGPPPWAVHTDGLPSAVPDAWELGYLTKGVNRAYDYFWGTAPGRPELMDHYVAAAGALAERFAGNPGVFGYDLFNEPWPGSLSVRRFERDVLTPLYRRLITRIRQYDTDSWLLVEPAALGGNWGLRTRLGDLPDPRPGEARILYAPHFYSLPHDVRRHYVGFSKRLIDASIRMWATAVVKDANRLGAPLLLGEYGLSFDDPGAGEFVATVQATLDALGSGSVYWNSRLRDPWSPWAGDGRPGIGLPALAHPYARAIPGTPVSMASDEATRGFRLTYDASAQHASAPDLPGKDTVEIWLPGAWYPNGVEVFSSVPEGTWSWDWDAGSGILSVTAAQVCGRQHIEVTPARRDRAGVARHASGA